LIQLYSYVVEQYDDQYVIIILYQYDVNEYNAIDYQVKMDIHLLYLLFDLKNKNLYIIIHYELKNLLNHILLFDDKDEIVENFLDHVKPKKKF